MLLNQWEYVVFSILSQRLQFLPNQSVSSVILLNLSSIFSLLSYSFLSTTNVKILKLFWDNDQVFTIFLIFHENKILEEGWKKYTLVWRCFVTGDLGGEFKLWLKADHTAFTW